MRCVDRNLCEDAGHTIDGQAPCALEVLDESCQFGVVDIAAVRGRSLVGSEQVLAQPAHVGAARARLQVPRREVLNRPEHPYTQKLVAAATVPG